MISMDMLHDAQQVLAPVISRTPMVSTKGIVPGCDFYLKADCLQKTGAFKLRGAYYKIATLSDEEKAKLQGLPTSLDAALDALEADHDYLTKGGVFPEALLRSFIAAKRRECAAMAAIPHPAEFERYYNL